MIWSNLQHECQKRETRVRHESYTNDAIATWVKNFDFDGDTSENIFSHPSIYYMASEILKGEKQFRSKNYILEMFLFHAKMRLKRVPQKLNLLIAKAISKSFTLDSNCKCPSETWFIKPNTWYSWSSKILAIKGFCSISQKCYRAAILWWVETVSF